VAPVINVQDNESGTYYYPPSVAPQFEMHTEAQQPLLMPPQSQEPVATYTLEQVQQLMAIERSRLNQME